MKLQFKFHEDTSSEDRERLLASLTDDGADKVERLFPDTDEVELALLYRALANDREGKKLLRRLKRSRAVEFAEPQPERHLVMPVELEEQMNGATARRRR
jgi:hypothetical protein